MSLPAGPLTRLTSAVREGRLLATTLVERSIERLQKHDPLLNVLAERAFDEALERAALVDRGVKHAGARVNVVVPGRLIDAGAIVVGKSTLPEFAIEGYTANLLTGVTRNPWNFEK